MNEMINGYDHQEDSLTWLARNIDVNELNGFSHARITEGKIQYYSGWNPSGAYTSEEILHRRAELQNKPSWDEMPEWADVWIESRSGNIKAEWYKDDKNRWVQKDGMFWSKEDNAKSMYIVHYPPETKPEWSGEGLPPVGIEVEVMHEEFRRWTGATTVGAFNERMVCAPNGGGFYSYLINEIRPIKSDKEKWVDKALSCLEHYFDAGDYQRRLFAHTYDALISGELPLPKGLDK